jgi:hypothetical protein
MAGNAKARFEKRQKEVKRHKKQVEKAAKQVARKEEKAKGAAGLGPGEDPDLAGLIAGPNQPLPEEAADLLVPPRR